MTPEKILRAAELIKQYNKLTTFLNECPRDANTFTITLRNKDGESKSTTLSTESSFSIIDDIISWKYDIKRELKALGVEEVEIDDTN